MKTSRVAVAIGVLMVFAGGLGAQAGTVPTPKAAAATPARPPAQGNPQAMPQKGSPKDLADRFFACAAKHDGGCMARLFQFPESYTPAEREKDDRAVASSVEAVHGVLGLPREPVLAAQPAKLRELAIGGGTAEYWKGKPGSARVLYAVRFEKAGKGYFAVEAVRFSGEWKLRAVRYSLAATDEKANAVLDRAFAALPK